MNHVENKLKSSPSVKVSEEHIAALLRKRCSTLSEVGRVRKKTQQGFLEHRGMPENQMQSKVIIIKDTRQGACISFKKVSTIRRLKKPQQALSITVCVSNQGCQVATYPHSSPALAFTPSNKLLYQD